MQLYINFKQCNFFGVLTFLSKVYFILFAFIIVYLIYGYFCQCIAFSLISSEKSFTLFNYKGKNKITRMGPNPKAFIRESWNHGI